MVNQVFKIFVVVVVLALASCSGKKATQVEQSKTNVKKVSIAEIESGIKDFIQRETEANDGYFHVEDKGTEYKMKLVRVHTEYLSNLSSMPR